MGRPTIDFNLGTRHVHRASPQRYHSVETTTIATGHRFRARICHRIWNAFDTCHGRIFIAGLHLCVHLISIRSNTFHFEIAFQIELKERTILKSFSFRPQYPSWIGLILALSWCALVCGSRLYLGMHSLLDIAAGLFISAILLVVLLPLVDYVDHLHLKSTFSPLISFPIVLLMAIYYPKSDRWTPARGDTCVIIGSCFGVLTGSWLNYQLGV